MDRRWLVLVAMMMASGCTAAEQGEDAEEGADAEEESDGPRSCEGEVDVPDPGLAAALRANLHIEDGAAIEGAALAELLFLDAGAAGIVSLEGLECAHALQTAMLGGNAITDASLLAELPALDAVYVSGNQITDVAPFAQMPQLQLLQIGSNGITDVSALRGHANLFTLGLEGNAITSTADIVDMPRLANLDLTDNPITTLEGLTGLSNLFALRLGGTMVTDLAALSSLPRVDNVHLERTGLTSLDSLPALSSVTVIDVSQNALTSVEALAGDRFPKLQSVTLDGNPLDGVESVAAIGVAHTISMNEVGVSDLAPLAVESSLRRLIARGNGITDLTPIAWIEHLDVADNELVDIGPLAGTAHASLDVSNNQIVDGSPLLAVEFDQCAEVYVSGNPFAESSSVPDDLCDVPVVVSGVCLPDACDPCGGAPDCG